MNFSLLLSAHKKGIVSFLVLLLLCAPITYKGETQKADAFLGALTGGGNLVSDIGNTLQNTLQTLSTQALLQKELVLDGMAFNIAQKALQEMTGDIIKWLNSGMDGKPAFVTDVLAYLQEASDKSAADFIYGDQLSTACKPFAVDVRTALAENYAKDNYGGLKETARCSVDESKVNLGSFNNGDFSAGGWSTWFEVVLNPQDTQAGYDITAKIGLGQAVSQSKYAAEKEADWGQGVLSKKTCTSVGSGASAKNKCIITTPGSIMHDLASKALGTGIDSLLRVHEMNEVIGTLYGNLAKEAITGVNGLLGLGGNSQFSNNTYGANGNLSYLDAVRQETKNITIGQTPQGGNQIQQALATETKVLELQLAIVDVISTTTKQFASTSKPFVGKSCWSLTLPDTLSKTLTDISAKLPKTISTVITLQDLAEKYASSTSAAEQLQFLQQLTALQSQNLLSGQAAVVEYDYFLNSELKTVIADFKKKLKAAVVGCS